MGAFNNRAMAWHSKKEYGKAIADFERAFELDPKSPYVLSNRAITYTKLKRYHEAVEGFEAALKIDSPDWIYREYAYFLATCPDAKYRDGKKAVELAQLAIKKKGTDAGWSISPPSPQPTQRPATSNWP